MIVHKSCLIAMFFVVTTVLPRGLRAQKALTNAMVPVTIGVNFAN